MRTLRLRMSLGSLLLLVTVFALALSHIITSRRLAATLAELASYRYQYGHLVVDDPTQPQALAYAKQENPWKWHVYFPKGTSYKLMIGIGEVPIVGTPDVSGLQHVHEIWVEGAGENKTMFVSITESTPDSLKVSLGCEGSQTVSQIVPKADVYANSVFNLFSIGHGATFAAPPDQPFVIFYRTERKTNLAGGSAGSENGIVVWAVPVK